MGVDLIIVPYIPRDLKWVTSTDSLSLNRHPALWDAIKALTSFPIPDDYTFTWIGDKGWQDVRVDQYGEPLRFVYASAFRRIDPEAMELSDWNNAVFAFIRALPNGAHIYLWWH